MRKRQWKKILSLVLALAMVFTMNTSVFAAANTEVSTPNAESTAQPEDTAAPAAEAETPAEAPAAEEPAAETPAEEPKAEEPAKVETPAAETPAAEVPAEETPAQPVESNNDDEQAAGTTIDDLATAAKWTAEGITGDGGYNAGNKTLTLNESSTATITLVAGDGAVDLNLTGSVANGSSITITGLNTPLTITRQSSVGAGITLGNGTYGVVGTKLYDPNEVISDGTDPITIFKLTDSIKPESYTFTVGEEEMTLGTGVTAQLIGEENALTDAASPVDISAVTTTALKYLLKKTDNADVTYNVFATPVRAAKPAALTASEVTETGMKITGVKGNCYQSSTDGESWEDAVEITDNSGIVELNNLTESTTYYFRTYVPAVETKDSEVFASAYSDVLVQATTATKVSKNIKLESGKIYTISGLTIDMGDDAEGSAISDNSGIYTVTLSSGNAQVTGRSQNTESEWEPISVNVADSKSTLTVADLASGAYDNMSIKGAGTVEFSLANAKKAVFDSVDSAISVSVNGSASGVGLVISNNSGAYKTVVTGKTEKQTVGATGKTIIYDAVAMTTGGSGDITENLNANTVTFGSTAGYVISDNNAKLFKIASEGVVDLSKASESNGVYYGKYVFKTANDTTDPSDGFKFYEISKRNDSGVTAIGFYPEDIGTGAAAFHITAPKELNKENINTKWSSAIKFAVSTDSTPYTEDLNGYVAAENPTQLDDKEYIYTLDGDHLAGGETKLKANTKYNVFVLNTVKTGYYSEPVKVGEFTTGSEKTLTLAAPTETVYAGYQKKEKNVLLDVAASGKLAASIEGATIERSGSKYNVKVDNVKVGTVTYYLLPANANAADITDFKKAENESGMPVGKITNLSSIVSGNYYAKAIFNGTTGDKKMFSSMSSNTLSFNVVPAPVKLSVKASTQTVAEKVKIAKAAAVNPADGKIAPVIAYINTLTEEDAGSTNFNANDVVYLQGTNNITNGTVSLNKGIYDYTISQNTVKPNDVAPYAAKYVIDWTATETGKLEVYGSASLTITALTVPYGTEDDSASESLNAVLNSTGTDEKLKFSEGTYEVKYYDVKYVSGNGLSTNAQPYTAGLQKLDAGTEVLAQAKYIGSKKTDDKDVMSNVVRVKIEQREIDLVGNDESFKSKRNVTLPEVLSINAAKITGTPVDGAHPYHGAAISNPVSKNAIVNKSDINIKIAGTYNARLTDVVLKDSKNFKVRNAYATYEVTPAYYAYWILEYGGHDKAATSQKFVSFNEVEVTANDGFYDYVIFKPDESITKTWNDIPNAAGVKASDLFKGTQDYISGWKARTEDGNDYAYNDTYWHYDGDELGFDEVKAGNYKFAVAGDSYTGDVYFYAVVAAKATENVTIKSLVPVTYDGRKHLTDVDPKYEKNDYSNTAAENFDLSLDIEDTEKGTTLTYGTDYTVSVKNNTNASVKFGDSGKADDIIQLYAEKKRPQVVVTGKGDYKGLKATVYFDILPKDINSVASTYLDNYKINKNGKGIKYTNKPYWTRTINNKTKTFKLSAKKDYTEKLQLITTENGKKFYTDADPKTLTAKGDYRFVMTGTGNYTGEKIKNVTIYDASAVFLSDLGFKAKNAKYTGSTISANEGFKLAASKKVGTIVGKSLKYGTDFTATTTGATSVQRAQMKDKMAVAAGTYYLHVKATPALIAKGVIEDTTTVSVKVNPKKLAANKFSTNWDKKGEAYDGKSKDVTVTSTTYTADKDYYAFPTSFVASELATKYDYETYTTVPVEEGDTVGDYQIDLMIENGEYVGGNTPKENLVTYKNIYGHATPYGTYQWIYDGKVTGSTYRYKLVANNAESGTYTINIIGKGEYSGSTAAVKYIRKPGKITSDVISVNQTDLYVNINGTYPAVSVKAKDKDGKDYWKQINNDDPTKADSDTGYTIKWSNNKKAGSTASVTVKGSAKDEFTGSAKKTFTIKQAPVTVVSALSIGEGLAENKRAGKFFAAVEDTLAGKNGKAYAAPKVTLYQYSYDGKTKTAAKLKNDYTFTYNASKTSENAISINAAANAAKSNLEIKKAVEVDGAVFSVFDAKAKNFDVVLSSNFTALSSNGTWKNIPYDSSKKSVTYTGTTIKPLVSSVTIDGGKYVAVDEYAAMTDAQKKDVKGTYELVITGDNVKVGTVKYEIRIKYTKGKSYVAGGSKSFTFKITPQTNNGLVLEK